MTGRICDRCGRELEDSEQSYFTENYDPSVPVHRTYTLCRICQIHVSRLVADDIAQARTRVGRGDEQWPS